MLQRVGESRVRFGLLPWLSRQACALAFDRRGTSSVLRRLTAVAAITLAAACSRTLHPLEGQPAPDIDLPLLSGGAMNLAAHEGRDIVLLDFWATWCGPCRTYMPIVERVAEDYADRGVVLYAVNSAEPAPLVRQYVQNTGLTSRVALDPQVRASIAYRAEELPMTVLIDRAGIVRKVYVGIGPGIDAELRRDLDKLLRE